MHVQIARADRDDDQISYSHREGGDIPGDVRIESVMNEPHAEGLELEKLTPHAEQHDAARGEHLVG